MSDNFFTSPTDTPRPQQKKRKGLYARYKEAVIAEMRGLGASERLADVVSIDMGSNITTAWYDKMSAYETANVLWKTINSKHMYQTDGKWHY